MNDGFLSQEEIDSLLNGSAADLEEEISSEMNLQENKEEILSDIEKDLLGEIGNISMGSASTALSTIIGHKVNITTPVVSTTTLLELKKNFEVPNIALDVKYTSGIVGENLLVMKTTDAGVIANLMMGGDGKIELTELSELEVSAVSEAMNQMIGSAATAMATMFSREVNISPPTSKIWDESTSKLSDNLDDNEDIVIISFKLEIGDLIKSSIMQALPVDTAKKIVAIMMGQEQETIAPAVETSINSAATTVETSSASSVSQPTAYNEEPRNEYIHEKPIETQTPPVEVRQASFQPLNEARVTNSPKNIDLILDVPLDISVVLGRTKKSIKDILNFGTGSLIELDKLAEEPVEILVNGKRIAYGEVVVVDENFGVRITNIVSSAERVKSLKGN